MLRAVIFLRLAGVLDGIGEFLECGREVVRHDFRLTHTAVATRASVEPFAERAEEFIGPLATVVDERQQITELMMHQQAFVRAIVVKLAERPIDLPRADA